MTIMTDFDEHLFVMVESALKEDIGDGDHSTLSCIPPTAMGVAELKIKEDGILAGVAVAEKIFKFKYAECIFTPFKKDGDDMKYGEKAFQVKAPVQVILQCERLVL